ncbi:MAG: hypothetical protein KKH67_05685, partial [candidate division Zixibacteria bacterium]|nr:hypothetical protein [candidate division Zixibacteria bacterium]
SANCINGVRVRERHCERPQGAWQSHTFHNRKSQIEIAMSLADSLLAMTDSSADFISTIE